MFISHNLHFNILLFTWGTRPNISIVSHLLPSIGYRFFPIKLNVWPHFIRAKWNEIGNGTQYFTRAVLIKLLKFKFSDYFLILSVLFYCRDLNLSHEHVTFIMEHSKRVTDSFQCTVFGLLLCILFLVQVSYFILNCTLHLQTIASISLDTASQESKFNLSQEESADYLKDSVIIKRYLCTIS